MHTKQIIKSTHNSLYLTLTHQTDNIGALATVKHVGKPINRHWFGLKYCYPLVGALSTRSYCEKGVCIRSPNYPTPNPEEGSKQVCHTNVGKSCDLVPCCPDKPKNYTWEKKPPRITIIGGGISGLTAAKYLIEKGFDNVLILEASNRPGGRIMSQWFGDTVVELGAGEVNRRSWNNPVMSEAVQDGHIRQVFANSDPFNGLLNGAEKKITAPFLYGYTKLNTILQELNQVKAQMKASERGRLYEYVSIRMKQIINNEPRELAVPSMKVMYGLINAVLRREGHSQQTISNEIVGPFMSVPGGEAKVPLGKIEELADVMRVVKNERVSYGKIVTNVKWGTVTCEQTPRAIVITEDGSEYLSDYVLVSLPLPVLKKNAESLFSPPFPYNKINALQKVPLKKMNKIFIEYSRPFWSWRECQIFKEWAYGELSHRGDWTRGITKLEEAPGSDLVLSVVVEGDPAIEMEKIDESEVAESLNTFVTGILCTREIPASRRLLRTTWFTNRFYQGSQCDIENAVDGQTMKYLLEPLAPASKQMPPVVYFGIGGSSIESGKLSGLRAAEKIVNAIKSQEVSDQMVECEKQSFWAANCS